MHQHHPPREAEVEDEETVMAVHSRRVLTEVGVVEEAEEAVDVAEVHQECKVRTTIVKPILEGHLGAASVLV